MSSSKAENALKLQGRLEKLYKELIDKGYELGIQTAVYLDGKQVVDICAGRFDETSSRKIEPDTLFPVCSTGKGVAVVLLHMLAERGVIDYESPVARYWPEYGVNGKERTTVRQALSHQAGIPGLPEFKTFAEIFDREISSAKIAAMTPLWTPGTNAQYHSQTFGWLLRRIVEGASGRPFMELYKEMVTRPLGIEREIYFASDDDADARFCKFVAQPAQQEQKTTDNSVHIAAVASSVPGPLMDFVNRQDARRACIPSSCGIMSARGIAKLYAAVIGKVDGVNLISKEALDKATTVNTAPGLLPACFGHGMGLGYALKGPASMPSAFFGHGGAGGSEGMADRKLGLTVGFVKNRMDTHCNAPGQTGWMTVNEIFDVMGHESDGGFFKQ